MQSIHRLRLPSYLAVPFPLFCFLVIHYSIFISELHNFGGLDSEALDSSTPDAKQGALPTKTSVDSMVPSLASTPHSDGYHLGVPAQRLSNMGQKIGLRSTQKWKGPDKISKIYGDWIDDL